MANATGCDKEKYNKGDYKRTVFGRINVNLHYSSYYFQNPERRRDYVKILLHELIHTFSFSKFNMVNFEDKIDDRIHKSLA